jgi:AcrR family transcriptional regulator
MADDRVQDIPKKKRQILSTAGELFFKHGIKRVTIEEICQKAGVSKMTFYKYFPDKIALAQHLWRAWIDEALAKFDEFEAMEISFAEKLEHIFEYSEQVLAKMENEFVKDYIAFELDHLDQDLLMQRMVQMFIKAQQSGEIRAEIHPELLIAIHEKTHELMHDEKLLAVYPDYTTFTRELFDLFYYGILTKPTQ